MTDSPAIPGTPPTAAAPRRMSEVATSGERPEVLALKEQLLKEHAVLKGVMNVKAERLALSTHIQQLDARLREIKERDSERNRTRAFAGLNTPVHQVLLRYVSAELVEKIEREAIEIQLAREREAAEKRLEKKDAK